MRCEVRRYAFAAVYGTALSTARGSIMLREQNCCRQVEAGVCGEIYGARRLTPEPLQNGQRRIHGKRWCRDTERVENNAR